MDDIWGYTPDEIRPFPALYVPDRRGVRRRVARAPTTSINIALPRASTRVLVLAVAHEAAGLSLVAPALVAALVFAVLPMQTESVAWITGRVDSMPACFFLASFLLLRPLARRARGRAYVWSVAWCASWRCSRSRTP